MAPRCAAASAAGRRVIGWQGVSERTSGGDALQWQQLPLLTCPSSTQHQHVAAAGGQRLGGQPVKRCDLDSACRVEMVGIRMRIALVLASVRGSTAASGRATRRLLP